MLNQGFLQDHEPTDFFPFPTNMISLPFYSNPTLKNISTSHPLSEHSKPDQDLVPLVQPCSNANYWKWSEVSHHDIRSNKIIGLSKDDHYHHHHHFGVLGINMKKFKSRKKVREPRFCFKTMSDIDVLNDGYKWRKYGQKVVKNTQHPRYINLKIMVYI